MYFSPMLLMAQYFPDIEFEDGAKHSVCFMDATVWRVKIYYLVSISIFFFCPFFVLIKLYCKISTSLLGRFSNTHPTSSDDGVLQSRKQVVVMLAVVVLVFFVCLLPFRALQLWIIFFPENVFNILGETGFHAILYLCRTLLYMNSAVNPIIYNAVSSKFRNGFRSFFRLKSDVTSTSDV